MSKLDELIQQLCPDGVEWKKIKDHFTRLRGTAITAGKMKEIADEQGDIRIFAGGKTVINAFEKDIPNANITRVPSVLVQSRGIIDVVYYEQPFTFKNEMWAYTSDYNVSVKFLFYYLKNNIEDLRQAAIGMGAMPQISLSATEEMFIPLPPLPIQEEIVRLLDQLTETTEKYQAELEVELDARKKQYEEYRNQLLDLEGKEGVMMKTLNEVCKNLDRQRIPIASSKREKGIYPYYGASGIVDYVKDYIFDGEYLLISEDGANLLARTTPIAFHIKGKNWVNNHAHILSFENKVTQQYVEFYLNNIDLGPWITGGAQPKLNQENLNKIPIPFPSLIEQERIVNILDRMDKIHKELCQSIETEIKMRKQQYEFYRNQLLDFKKKEV